MLYINNNLNKLNEDSEQKKEKTWFTVDFFLICIKKCNLLKKINYCVRSLRTCKKYLFYT